jgi:hypothetical protein
MSTIKKVENLYRYFRSIGIRNSMSGSLPAARFALPAAPLYDIDGFESMRGKKQEYLVQTGSVAGG